jgi:hypothetical protein
MMGMSMMSGGGSMLSGAGKIASQSIQSTASNFMSIGSASKRKRQVREQYDAQANIALQNSRIARNTATNLRIAGRAVEKAGRIAKNQQFRKDQRNTAEVELGAVNSGVQLEGTPLMAIETMIQENTLRQRQMTYDSYLQKRQYMEQARQYDYQEKLDKYQARQSWAMGKYKREMIDFQKKLTIAKMFYDPANTTHFGEIDNPSQFSHTDLGGGLSQMTNAYKPNFLAEKAKLENKGGIK